jgi:hypothetical protein
VSAPMFHFYRTLGTDLCARNGYGVCRGPGGPLGEVWGARA